MPISRSQMPRQMYGLGSFVKSIGKAAKKIVKSPIGKAALLYGGLKLAPMALGKIGQSGGFSNLIGSFASQLGPQATSGSGLLGLLGKAKTAFSGMGLGSKANLGILGASALSGLFAGKSQEEIQEIQNNPTALRGYLENYFTKLNPNKNPAQINELVEANMIENRSEGGRIGYADGTEEIVQPSASMMVDTTTYNPIPEDADRQGAAEIAKVMMATRDLPREEGEIEDTETMSTKQFMTEQYLMPKVKELVENFGISKIEALKMVRDEMMKLSKPGKAMGGRINRAYGSDELVEQASGIEGLDININPKGVKELDLRDSGGFIPPVGVKEKADDIPAMLSNNEFVFTADAVRGMGDGNVNKGAQRMYDMMKKLENGGRV